MARAGETWAPGALIPGTDYRIVRLIGRGGFGEVFEVEHVHLTRRFAVKVLSRAHAGRGDLVERLVREARSLARLHPHPNLVEVTDMRRAADGRAFLVMERLRGRTLSEALRGGGAMPIGHAADVMRQLLRALGAAHRIGLVHRDVKPSNIFLCDDGVVKLLDFGIVKVLTETGGSQTMPGSTVGTPGYMAPEFLEGATPDARSDVYSAGVVLWEALAGHSPFLPGQLGHELLACVLTQGIPALEDRGHAALPAALRAVVRKATARKPAARHASADDFALALEAALREGDVPRPARVFDPNALPPAPAATGANTAPGRDDATTGRLAQPAPSEPFDGEAADTVRGFAGDGPLGASLRSLFDEPARGASESMPAGTLDLVSVPNPDRVEYALARLPTPPSGTHAPRAHGAGGRRVVLELPPGAVTPPPSAKALAFAPTLASVDAFAEPPPELAPPRTPALSTAERPPPRAPALSTLERQARDMPTPTAVPNVIGDCEGEARVTAEQGGVASTGEAPGKDRGRRARLPRAGFAVIAGAVAIGVTWACLRGGPSREAARAPSPVDAASAAAAPSGGPELAPRASLASAASLSEPARQGQEGGAPDPVASAEPAPPPATSTGTPVVASAGPVAASASSVASAGSVVAAVGSVAVPDAPASASAALAAPDRPTEPGSLVAPGSLAGPGPSAVPGSLAGPGPSAASGSLGSSGPAAPSGVTPAVPVPVVAAAPSEVTAGHEVPSAGPRSAQASSKHGPSEGRPPAKPKSEPPVGAARKPGGSSKKGRGPGTDF
jgi:eukaryotic-like serine/threonine-protein kinase